MPNNLNITLIIGGGIAAYKSLELIRRLRERGAVVRCILTQAASQFVTPLSVSALSEQRVFGDLFSLTEESEMGHIRLAREADLVVVAPATADLMARMAAGQANDLASAVLLATTRPILIAPSMNVAMWQHPATQDNLVRLKSRGVRVVGPAAGDLACGEVGSGRLAEVADILAAIEAVHGPRPLQGRRALVTSGPTLEPIDPVRYISNRSSGKQGHAIAGALALLGAETHLVHGPSYEPIPADVIAHPIETAREMLEACEAVLPVDVAVCAAAVADWRVAEPGREKLKKQGAAPRIDLIENPDILARLAQGNLRPTLVVGFAAETTDLIENARAKRQRKGCDWIVANDVGGTGVFGGTRNQIHLVTASEIEAWPELDKIEVAARLAQRIARYLSGAGHEVA